MSLELHELQDLVASCDPGRPLPAGSEYYVDFDAAGVRGLSDQRCTAQLERTILLNKDPTCQLFTGFPGSGKTTELRRLGARLEANKSRAFKVVVVDFDRYIDRHSPLSLTDILRVLAFDLERAAVEAEGGTADQATGYLETLYQFLQRLEPSFKQVGFNVFGAGLILEFKDNPDFRQRARDAVAKSFQAFARDARHAMSEAVRRLKAATGAEQVVVIADELEKVQPLDPQDRPAIEASLELVFVKQANYLQQDFHTIYTFPQWLRFSAGERLGIAFNGEPQVLPMVNLAEPGSRVPSAESAGARRMAELIRLRMGENGFAKVFGDGRAAVPLLMASGGYARDLLRMVRNVLHYDTVFPLSPELDETHPVMRVIARLRESYEMGLLAPQLDMLVQVAASHAIPSASTQDVAEFGRLVDRWMILAYRNGHEWYDVHPLVRELPAFEQRAARYAQPLEGGRGDAS